MIAAGVMLASFAVFAPLAALEDAELARTCGRDVPTTSCSEAQVTALRVYSGIADASWIGAALSGALGLVLLLALPPERSGVDDVALVPALGPDLAALTLQGSF